VAFRARLCHSHGGISLDGEMVKTPTTLPSSIQESRAVPRGPIEGAHLPFDVARGHRFVHRHVDAGRRRRLDDDTLTMSP